MLDTECLSSRAQVEPIDGKPLFVKLFLDKDVENPLIRKAVIGANNLSAEKVAYGFMGEMSRCLQQCQEQARRDWGSVDELMEINDRTRLRQHGPAVQMDVMPKGRPAKKPFYSVDMVPTIQISGRNGEDEYYVPKPIKGEREIAWRRSFSLKEKQYLATIDRWDNGCRKQVLRVLKVIRNREPGLAPLTSYHLKSVLFRKSDELSNRKIDYLGKRLMDVIGQIIKESDREIMPHYFLQEAFSAKWDGRIGRRQHAPASETLV